MNNVFGNRKFVVLMIMVVYIVGLLSGVAAIRYYFLQSKIEELQPQLKEIERDLSSGKEIPSYNFFMIRAYDSKGREIDVFTDSMTDELIFKNEQIDETLQVYVPDVMQGNQLAELRNIPGLPSSSIVLGEPLRDGDNITGAVFLLKPASDYRAALNGFYLVFFITLTLGTCIILFFLKLFIKERNQLDQTRKDYVANISHELKSPLSSIKALTETLSDGVVSDQDKVNQYYGIILRESARLERLVNDLLELSRLQSGTEKFEKSSTNTGKMIWKAIEPFLVVSDDLELKIQVLSELDAVPEVQTNEDRIIQVMTILLDNAIKFAREQIIIDTQFNAKQVIISIEDDGPGIPHDQLPLIFERFHKGDLSRNSQGSGLGLSIAEEIMKQLNGKLAVESRVDEGSKFLIFINRR